MSTTESSTTTTYHQTQAQIYQKIDPQPQTLYQEFCRTHQIHKPSLKEIITLNVKNLLDLSKSIISIYSQINRVEKELSNQISDKVKNWHNEVISSTLSQRRSFSRLISDLKYTIGSVEGADEIFLNIDQLTQNLRQDWSPNMTSETGNSLRKNFLDLILIIDPDITGSVDNGENDLGVIKERLKEVERTSLTFLDMNSKMFKEIRTVTDFFKTEFCGSSLKYEKSTKGKDFEEEARISETSSSKTGPTFIDESMPSLPISLKAGRYENINDITKKPNFEVLKENKKILKNFKKNMSVKMLRADNHFGDFSIESEKSLKLGEAKVKKMMKILSEPNLIPVHKKSVFSEEHFNDKENVLNLNKMQKINEVDEQKYDSKSGNSDKKIDSNKEDKINILPNEKENQQENINNANKKFSLTSNCTPINFESNHTFAPGSNRQSQKKGKEPQVYRRIETAPSITSKSSFRQPLTQIKTSTTPNRIIRTNLKPLPKTPIRTRYLDSKIDIPSQSVSNSMINLPSFNNLKNSTSTMSITRIHNHSKSPLEKNAFQKQNHRILNFNDLTPVKSTLNRSIVKANPITPTSNSLKIYNNNGLNSNNLETYRSKNLPSNRSNSSLLTSNNNGRVSYHRILSNSRSPISTNRVLSSTRRDYNSSSRNIQNIQNTRVQNFNITPLSVNNRTLSSDRVIRRVYTSGSQNNTPLRINYHSIQVNSVTPQRFNNPQNTSNNIVTPIKNTITNDEKENIEIKKTNVFKLKKPSFDIGEFLGNRKSEKLHVNVKKVEKIVTSNDGGYLLFGGLGLNVLDMAGNRFKLIRFDKDQKWKFNSIKILNNDNILITQPMTNDLVVLDNSFREIKRLKGIQGDSFDNEAIRNSRFSTEGNNFIWFKGGNTISVVDTTTFNTKDIHTKNRHSLPLAITANTPLTKLISLTVVEDENIYLNYWESSSPSQLNTNNQSSTEFVESRFLTNVCPSLKAAMSLEISKDEKTVFIGGCNKMDIFEGKATIAAVHFNKYMVNEANIELHDKEMRNIFQIRRYEGTNADVLFVGGFNSLSIIEYRSDIKTFFELKLLKNLHTGEIFDFCIRGRDIFTVCANDEYIHKF